MTLLSRSNGHAPTVAQPGDSITVEENRPTKRIRASSPVPEADDILVPHLLGVRPEGNAYTELSARIRSNAGLFASLPDELLSHFLEYLSAGELVSLGSSCKTLYAFCRVDELWKALFVQSLPKDFDWRGTWRSTYLKLPSHAESSVSCHGLYSDVLYRPFFCAHTSLGKYAKNIPRGNAITRMDNLTYDDYTAHWSEKPFILTAPIKEWPIYTQWTTQSLLKEYENVTIRAEAVDWPLRTYVSYMDNNQDESPLYLFDRSFAEKMDIKIGRDVESAAYWPPDCFGDDLFSVLGAQRPDSRWLIMGPARSGSTFHKDPNATSAWNAVLTGSKYWLMFPSGPAIAPPPGVILSEDHSEITSPVSITEYMLSFHELARSTPGCKEGICHAGEVLHVPSGWFHLVLNLEDSIALTQNFVPKRKLVDVLRFLRDSRDQVSGFNDDVTDPYALFEERLRETYPELLEQALEKLNNSKGPTKWEKLVKHENNEKEETGGFSFGFGGDSDGESEVL